MSTSYRPLRNIRAAVLFEDRLEMYNVFEHYRFVRDGARLTTATSRCLTDGLNYLWVDIGEDGIVSSFHRSAGNEAKVILRAVAKEFDTDIASEYQPQYWGFDTEEEWHAALAKSDREDRKTERKFEKELLKYVRGEPHNIKPATNEESLAKIAKKLAEEDPTLLFPVNRKRFRSEIKSLYDREVLQLPF
jgi:hypothetical protein